MLFNYKHYFLNKNIPWSQKQVLKKYIKIIFQYFVYDWKKEKKINKYNKIRLRIY